MKSNRKYNFYNNIQLYREMIGYTQQQLAKRVGVSRNTISSLERGEFSPSAYLSGLLCRSLHCTWEELFYYEKIE